jgi:hypothetical protein
MTTPSTRFKFEDLAVRVSPPWLQRTVGGALMRAFGAVMDDMLTDAVQGVGMRFPTDVVAADALALTGKERRMLRGPAEASKTYARRIRRWWDANKLRGGPYELLREFQAYLTGTIDSQIELVYYSGQRYTIPPDPDTTITRDSITWDADGSGHWARIWLFLEVESVLVTDAGETIVTDAGDTFVAFYGDPSDPDVLTTIPKDWAAAHIELITIVLLTDSERLWDYPTPTDQTWDTGTGGTWDDGATVVTVSP